MSLICELLVVKEETKQRVKKMFGKAEDDIQKDLTILLLWLKKQVHLPQCYDKARLENYLLRNKFRIQQTKHKLDKYFTYKVLYSDFFLNVDPASSAIENFRKAILWVPMPHLPPTMERITVIKFRENKEDFFNLTNLFTYALNILDLQLSFDYAIGERYIVDASNLSFKYLFKMDPNVLAKGLFLTQEAFSGRIIAINYINLPSTWNYALSLLKQALNRKIFNKVTTCKTLNSLYEIVPRKYLPKDYGGDQEYMSVLHEKWGKELIYQRDFLLKNSKKVSNEKLRIGKPMQSDLFGVDGMFKEINLD